ncbi:UNVERIFIED_CONTAM: hypothetical protein GTU68_035783 [Idotea baltica]|nr:hypothetical protein [Idotea baltica]
MFLISVELTFYTFLLLPITHFISRFIVKKIRKSSEEELSQLIDLSDHSIDRLNNIELVKLSNTYTRETDQLEYFSDKAREANLNVRKKSYLTPAVIDVINSTGVIIIVCVSVILFFSFQSYSIGRLLVFFVSLRRFTSFIQQLTSTWANVVADFPIIDRIYEILSTSKSNKLLNGEKEFSGIKKDITFSNLSLSYDNDNIILNDLNFSIKAKEVIALVGSTGAGKTSIINLIPRFYDPSKGSISIDGIDLRKYEVNSLRDHLGLVTQNSLILDDTIRNNIVYGLDNYTEKDFQNALKQAQLEDFIKNLPLGVDTELGSRGVKISGGEKQRISIARALLKKADILLLDEATSALDVETEMKLQKAIELAIKDKTVIVIAHRLATIRNADKILVIEKGQIIESGTPNDLIESSGKFKEFCNIQNIYS